MDPLMRPTHSLLQITQSMAQVKNTAKPGTQTH